MNQNDPLDDLERPLPVGREEFEEFAKRIISKGANYADEDSIKFSLCSLIMHADSNKGAYSDKYFLERLRKGAANQVAHMIFIETKKRKEEEQRQAEEAAKQAEATASESVANGQKEN